MRKSKMRFACLLMVSLLMVGLISGTVLGAEKLVLKLPHTDNIGDPLDKSINYFAELVNETSFGDIDVTVYGGGQLAGTQEEVMESCKLGVFPLVKVNLGSLIHYAEVASALELPFLFEDRAHVAKVLSGPVGDKLTEWIAEDSGLRVLSWFSSGFQNFYTKKPVTSIEDIKGMNMRVMNSPSRKDSMNSYGARAVTVAWQEAYGAFQQGVADGGENSISLIYTSRQYEVLPYITLSRHFRGVDVIVMNESFYQDLTAEQQNIFVQAGELMESYNRKLEVREEEKYMQMLRDEGVEILELDPGAREDFMAAAKEVWKKYSNTPRKKEVVETITGVDL